MIIDCGKRRLVSNKFGWRIEILHTTESGKQVWQEDRPAYPATLSQACEMICERELKDRGDITLDELTDALRDASATVRKYFAQARAAA